MTGGTAKYVPVLRLKKAELSALRQLSRFAKGAIQPLLELVPPRRDGAFGHLGIQMVAGEIFRSIISNWGNGSSFLDAGHLIREGGLSNDEVISLYLALAQVSEEELFGRRELSVIPTLTIRQMLEARETGKFRDTFPCIALRMPASDLRRAEFRALVNSALDFLGYKRSDVHLILDFGFMCEREVNVMGVIASVNPEAWRSVTYLAGSFPKDLTELRRDDRHVLQRIDWQCWRELARSKELSFALPSFGDYTVQHAIYSDPPDGGGNNVSASLRYTLKESWIVMRGSSVALKGRTQWLAQAKLLVDSDDFAMPVMSAGDRYIYNAAARFAAQDLRSTGSPTTWLKAAINRHLEVVAQQVYAVTVPARSLTDRAGERRARRTSDEKIDAGGA